MDNEIKWGADIPVKIVDDEKPEFLRDDQICAVWQATFWFEEGGLRADEWTWHSGITKIKLLADDPYYQQQDQAVTPEAVDIELRKWAMEQAIAFAPHGPGASDIFNIADLILAWVTKKP